MAQVLKTCGRKPSEVRILYSPLSLIILTFDSGFVSVNYEGYGDSN